MTEVEVHCPVVDCVDDDESGRGRLAGEDGLPQRLGQKDRAQAPALLGEVDGEPS